MFKGIQKALRGFIVLVVFFFLFIGGYKFVAEFLILKRIIHNLKAESRIAEVLVTGSSVDEYTRKYTTTIKFLEYDVNGKPLQPKYFTFKGNLIQFQTLVVRFDDKYVEEGHRMRGKSVYLFLKAFVLDGKDTQEFVITPVYEITKKSALSGWPRAYVSFLAAVSEKLSLPGKFTEMLKHWSEVKTTREYTVPDGYRAGDPPNYYEKEIWRKFWKYALEPNERQHVGIKNAQVEAPGSVFIPGTIYTLMIEHDGGIRIDTRPIPEILK